ncbi:MAG: beta-ketoacyl-[acyl-carrier-protein] synthase family protein [Thermoguttaceae bacterium]
MQARREVVITGIGVVSPIGIGAAEFWRSLMEGRGGVRRLSWFDGSDLPAPIGAEVSDFDPARMVRPRKALKVMSRDIQLAVVAADMACSQAGLAHAGIDPDRLGVVFGADLIAADPAEMVEAYRACMDDGHFDFRCWGQKGLGAMFPLWMLKYLPNMPACHIGIIQDARGPNNTHTLGEISGLTAVAEAADVIRRGQADAMIAGGTSSRIHPSVYLRTTARQFSQRLDDPARACRPFDADRDGMVYGEGAAAFLLEAREHAAARGANCLARIVAGATAFEPPRPDRTLEGQAIGRAIRAVLAASGLKPSEIGHVNAHGLSTTMDDRIEARAIRQTLGDVPVTAPKSFFGNIGGGGGGVEMAVSVLAFQHGLVPPTLNYERPDPDCPIQVIQGGAHPVDRLTALVLNHSSTGQAAAMILAGGD